MDWIATVADWVRSVVAGQAWLEPVAPLVAGAPDWMLVAPAPLLFIVLTAWTVGNASKSTKAAVETTREGLSIMTAGAVPAPARPAKENQVKALEAKLQALSDAQRAQVAALEAKLDAMNARLAATGETQPIAAEQRERRNAAVTEIVAEATPAALAFERTLDGGVLDLTALKAEARGDAARAAEKWRRIGAIARGVNDGEALAAYEEAHRLDPAHFWTCVELSRLYLWWKGDVVAARGAAEAAERAANDERERAVAHNDLGNMLLAAGDLAGARARFEECNAVLERLAAANPCSAEAQRDVSVSLIKLGDALVKAGDLAGAKARFEASLEIADRLARENRNSAEAQRDLWVNLIKLGDVLVQASDPAGAKARFEASLEIPDRLARENRDSAEAQRDLSVNLIKLGEVLAEAGDLAGAKARFEASLEIADRLAREDRDSAQAQRGVGLSLERLGGVQALEGKLEDARGTFERKVSIDQRLVESDPANVENQRNLSIGLNKLGDVLVQVGDLAGAKARFEQDLAIAERLAAANPGSAEAQRDVWVSLWRMANQEGSGVRWTDVAARMQAMKDKGTLFPVDEKFLEAAKANAAKEAGQ